MIFLLIFSVMSTTAWAQESGDEPSYETDDEMIEQNQDTVATKVLPLLQTIEQMGTFETFLGFIRASGLDAKLKGDGPFTIFAPDDSAFAQLMPYDLEELSTDKDYLTNVIMRHMVKRLVKFDGEPGFRTVKALNGDILGLEVTETMIRIEDAWVIDEQINCTNGIIHVIDAVLIPQPEDQEG